MASFDYDGDGLVDLYFVNGAPLKGSADKTPLPMPCIATTGMGRSPM